MMFIPGCGCCGQPQTPCPGCPACTIESLPDTVTVSLSNIQVQGPDLIQVGVTSCFGFGASGRITGPHGMPGAITGAAVLSGGSGYAKLGRVAPTVSASGGSGTAATLTVTLSPAVDACGVDYWEVESVAVSGGTGYLDGDQLTFTAAEGDTVATAATATIHTTRTEPTLTATASGGSGADLAITLNSDAGPPATWGVASVAVDDGGTGYTDGSPVTISFGSGDVQSSAAVATITTNHLEPTMAGATLPYSTGTGADLVATLGTFTGSNGKTYWEVTALAIDAAGTGYQQYDTIAIAPTNGQSWDEGPVFVAYVDAVDENGAITAVAIYSGGTFFKDGGEIQSVEVTASGAYYSDDGIPVSVSVESGGEYYREDIEAEPYVADVTVTLTQEFTAGCYSEGFEFDPENATGAVVTATVGDDPNDPATFGKITGFSVSEGGSGWLASLEKDSPLNWFDGKTFVLHRGGCVYSASCLEATHFGTAIEFHPFTAVYACKPRIVLLTNSPYDSGSIRPGCFATASFSSDTAITICDELRPAEGVDLTFTPVPGESPAYLPCSGGGPWSETLMNGATATITAGGEYTPSMKCFSASQSELNSISVQAQFAGETFDFVPTNTETECETDFQWSPYYDAADCEFADDIIPASGIVKFCRAQKTVTCDPDFVYLNTRWVCESWIVAVSIDDATASERSCSPHWKISISASYNRWELGNGQTLSFNNVSSIQASRAQTWYILKEGADYPAGTFTIPAFETSPLSPNYGEQQGNLVVTLTAPP